MLQEIPIERLAPRYWLTWIGVGLLRLSVFLPYTWLLVLGRGLGRLGLRLAESRRRIAETNLRLCFPDLDEHQRRGLLEKTFESLGIGLFEACLCWWGSDAKVGPLARIEGLEHLEQAFARGKGVILLSAHFTTLEIGGRLLATRAPIHVMYRRNKNPVVEHVIRSGRNAHSEGTIPRDNAREMIRVLRANKAVWYAPDQNTQRKTSVFADFFGIPATTSTGTSRLSRLTGAAVVPFLVTRREDGSGYELRLEPPLADFPSDDAMRDADKINRLFERWVRRNPTQYLWIHRRFRTRPNRSDPSLYD